MGWLKKGDRASINDRLMRAKRLVNHWRMYEFDYLLHGGTTSAQILHELKMTFLFCCNISTVLLSLMFVEKELAGYAYLVGMEDATKIRLELLLKRALKLGWITTKEFDTFDHLRNIRNSYAHFRSPTHASDILMRSLDQRTLPDHLFEQDAFDAMEAVVSFLHRDRSAGSGR